MNQQFELMSSIQFGLGLELGLYEVSYVLFQREEEWRMGGERGKEHSRDPMPQRIGWLEGMLCLEWEGPKGSGMRAFEY